MTVGEGTELILVRHGETVWNVEGRMQGSEDSPLTTEGEAQVEALAWRLWRSGSRPITCIYTSPLGRAQGTAEILANGGSAGAPAPRISIEADLVQRRVGVLEGLTDAETMAKCPDVAAANATGDEDYAPPGGGESRAQVRQRALRALAAIASRHPGERVLVVTHGAVLAAVARGVLGAEGWSFGGPQLAFPNAAVNLLRWKAARWQLATWGDTGEFCPGAAHGYWLVDAAAAMRLIGAGAVLGALAGLGLGVVVARRRR